LIHHENTICAILSCYVTLYTCRYYIVFGKSPPWVTVKTVTDENGDSQDGDNQNGDSQNGDKR